jgi:Fe-S cluster assembly protein SufD
VTAVAATAEETVLEPATAPWVLALAESRRERPEPPFAAALRARALGRFGELGFPSPREEAWRGTNVGPVALGDFAEPLPLSAEAARVAEVALAPYLFEAAATLVFVDGRFDARLSKVPALGEGVVASSLQEALAHHPDLVEPHLGRHASFERASFVALNTALWGDGAFVSLPRGAVLAEPIHLIFAMTGAPAAGGRTAAAFPRNLVLAGENAQVKLVETYVGLGSREGADAPEPVYLTCGVTELVAGDGAVVDHYRVQRESREAFHLATFELVEGRASNVSSHSIALGGGLVRNDVNALLDGEGSETILNGLYMIGGRQHVDNHMRVEHAKPHCASHELYKGILDGKARAIFNGLIHVRHGAQKTDAKQSNRNLLLSRDAVANSNPQLEIFADDVKCTHGSTVGQLDDDAVFYLRSRGIGEEAARSILTYAFASDIVERIQVPAVRRDLEEYLFTRLPKGEVVRQSV